MAGSVSFYMVLLFVTYGTCLRVLTSRLKKYQSLNAIGLDVDKTSALTFQIVACSDVHFGFYDVSSGIYSYKYELVIGGWGNTWSRVRRGRDEEYIKEVVNSPLSCCKFNTFWISWNNPLSAGYGFEVGVNPFIQVETDLGPVTKVAITTGYDHLGVWVFNFDQMPLGDSDYNVDGYDQCTTNNVTYNLPVYPTSSKPVYYPTSSKPVYYPTSSKPVYNPTSSKPEYNPTSSKPEYNPTSSTPVYYPTSSKPVYSSAHASHASGLRCAVVTTCNIWGTYESSSSDVMTSMTSSEESMMTSSEESMMMSSEESLMTSSEASLMTSSEASLMTSMETSSLVVFDTETSSSIQMSMQQSDRTSQTPSLEISPSPTETGFTSTSHVTIPETTPTDNPGTFWCPCDWPINGKINLSVEQKIARYRHSLTLIKSNLSAVRRRLTSAYDVRPSSRYMGASGATILGLVFGVIVMADVQRILECFMDRKRRVCHTEIVRKEEKCETSSC